MDFNIKGQVHGIEEVQKMFARCPKVLQKHLHSWLLEESGSFIGSKKMHGRIKSLLEKKGTWISGRGWRSQVTGLFKGKITDPVTNQVVTKQQIAMKIGAGQGLVGKGISMNLKMGILYNNPKPIHQALESLIVPHSNKSEKYMPIPWKGSDMVKAHGKFQFWLKNNKFFVVYKNGRSYYYLKDEMGTIKGKKQFGKTRMPVPKFVGMKTSNVKFYIPFYQIWQGRQFGINDRAGKAVENAIAEID